MYWQMSGEGGRTERERERGTQRKREREAYRCLSGVGRVPDRPDQVDDRAEPPHADPQRDETVRERDRYIHAAELQTEMERAAGGSGHPLEIQGMKTPCAISN